MNLQIPSSTSEWEAFVKENLWTILIAALSLIAVWQGLTLYSQVRSWQGLQTRVGQVVMQGSTSAKGRGENPSDESKRSVVETFFYRPSSTYNLTAIFDDRAVVNGQEVKVGDRLERAVVEKIEINSVTLKEEGEDSPKRIEMHPGL